jgi:glycosyltransferase involved in cell wall biosynthesis
LNSILTQEFTRDFKVIVCDDASFDNTSDIVTENFSNFENFHIFKNDENIGVSENFIKCTNQSSAKYIAILEGDDYWIEPSKLDLQIKAMEEYPETSFCFTDVRVEKNGIRENIHPNLGGKTRMFSAIDLVDQTGSIAQTCTLLIRRKFLQGLPDWVLNSYTLDWCLQIFLANQGPAIYIPQTTAVYRIHDQGVWSKLNPFEGWRKNLKFYETVQTKFHKRSERKRIKKRISLLVDEALELANVHFNKKEIRFWLINKLIKNSFIFNKQSIQSLKLLVNKTL